MTLSRKAKNQILRILEEEGKDGVSIERLMHGKMRLVTDRSGTAHPEPTDIVNASEEDIFEFLTELQTKGKIRPINRHNLNFYCLTEKGKSWIKSKDFNSS